MGKFFKLPFEASVGGAIGFVVAVVLVIAIMRKLPIPSAIKP